ncbi:MAG: LacI family transcriptional regulator [Acidobacteria bacterium]|nr:LacI family transcriptional regulator [Acidobacteriota bacterium]
MGSVSIVSPYEDRWFFSEVLRGAVARIVEAGHEPLVHIVPRASDATVHAVEAVTRDFESADAIGAIAVGFRYRADQRERTLAWRRPLVMIGGSVTGFPTVMIDDVGASWTATDHLMQLGHTRITHIAGDLSEQMDFSVHGRRARGYRLAMERAGLAPAIVEVEFDPQHAYEVATRLLEPANRPTAVFVVSDEVAFPIMAAARDLGLEIGTDLSVVGFDDHPRAEQEDLTTIRQRPAELGAAAAELLLSGVGHGPDPKQSKLVGTQLVKRGSARRLR